MSVGVRHRRAAALRPGARRPRGERRTWTPRPARSPRRSRRPSAPPAASRWPGQGRCRRTARGRGPSACVNASNRRAEPVLAGCRCRCPAPRTAGRDLALPCSSLQRDARTTTSPRRVNLMALPARLSAPGAAAGVAHAAPRHVRRPPGRRSSRPFWLRLERQRRRRRPPRVVRRSKSSVSSSSLPASIFEKSRMSLISVSSDSPLVRTISAYSRCSVVRPRVQQQAGHADDAVHRRADLVAHVGQELALGHVGGSASTATGRAPDGVLQLPVGGIISSWT